MKKYFFLLISLAMATMYANAQSLVDFHLSPDGSFITKEVKNYTVVPFEGKNAHQIFQQLCTNVSKLYKNPSKVMSVVDDVSITIRAYDSRITYIKDLIQTYDIGGYYNITFEIKDGRVKVSSPIIDESMTKTINGGIEKDYSRLIKSWTKDGSFKEKFAKQVGYTESNMNTTINDILGSSKSNNDENW